MRSPVISDQHLVENPEARSHHQKGLSLALGFAEAMNHFEEADSILSITEPTIDRNVQMARVRRDQGFTMVRQALQLEDVEMLNGARIILQGSACLTEAAAGQRGEMQYDPASVPSSHGTRKPARREIFAEHGATLGILGRLTTAEEVLLDIKTSGNSEKAVKARLDDQAYYGAAHDFLRIGNNGYYLVSNAMCAARQEVLNGQRLGMITWLARATRGLAWTAVNDRHSVAQAFATAGSRLQHVADHDTARESVFYKP